MMTTTPPTNEPKPKTTKPRRKQFVEKPRPTVSVDASFPPKFGTFLEATTFFSDVDPLTLPLWLAVYGGRGSGKTTSIAQALALMGKAMPLRILCAREIMKSLKESSHHEIRSAIRRLGLSDWYTVTDDRITGQLIDWINPQTGLLEKRRTEFLFVGLRSSATGNTSNLEAIKSYGDIQICWIDEAAPISKTSWDILDPTIRRHAGSDPRLPCQIWLSWNPRNEFDFMHQRFVVNPPPPETATVVRMDYWDNPWWYESGLSAKMELMKAEDYENYLHVYEGHLRKYYEGMVFKAEMKSADKEKRICDVPYRADGNYAQAFFDIGGGGDKTAVWIAQKVGEFVHVLDYHEAVQASTDYWLSWIENRAYSVTKIWLPHDAKQRHGGMTMSYEQLIRNKGKHVGIVPAGKGSVDESINALRVLFPVLKIDQTKCATGIQCLRNYRYELIDDDNIDMGMKQVPVHDRYSHGADAARYMAVAFRQNDSNLVITPGKYGPTGGGFTSSVGWMRL